MLICMFNIRKDAVSSKRSPERLHSLHFTSNHFSFFSDLRLSSILFGWHDPLTPFENLFCAIFLGGLVDALRRAVEGKPYAPPAPPSSAPSSPHVARFSTTNAPSADGLSAGAASNNANSSADAVPLRNKARARSSCNVLLFMLRSKVLVQYKSISTLCFHMIVLYAHENRLAHLFFHLDVCRPT